MSGRPVQADLLSDLASDLLPPSPLLLSLLAGGGVAAGSGGADGGDAAAAGLVLEGTPWLSPSSTTATTRQAGDTASGDDSVIVLPSYPELASVTPGGLQPGGEDWIELRYEGSWDPRVYDDLARRLDAAKAAAGRARESGHVPLPEGDDLVVQHHDLKKGRDKWEWIIRWQGATIMIKRGSKAREGEATVKVELPSAAIMRHGGGDAAVAIVGELLRSMGYRAWANVLSRVDPCADVYGVPAERLIALARSGHAVKRATGDPQSHEHFDENGVAVVHSWAIGSSVRMRIYAKGRELLAKPNPVKEALLRECRWGCGPDVPLQEVVATRVEFQLRRKALRDSGVQSYEDWQKKRSQVIAWLSHEWFRVMEEKPDRVNRHQDRGQVHADWRAVVDCFAQWVGRAAEPLVRRTPGLPDLKNLVMSGWGYVTSICARSGKAITSIEEAVSFVVQLGLDEMERMGRTLSDELFRKRHDYLAATGAFLPVEFDPDDDIPF